jgi:hypothetical protein
MCARAPRKWRGMRCLEEPWQGGEIVESREEIFRLRDQGAQVVCVHASESVVAVREKVCRVRKNFLSTGRRRLAKFLMRCEA